MIVNGMCGGAECVDDGLPLLQDGIFKRYLASPRIYLILIMDDYFSAQRGEAFSMLIFIYMKINLIGVMLSYGYSVKSCPIGA